jgi:murein L,D-transpeptidase YafK
MKTPRILFTFLILTTTFTFATDFLSEQKKNARVKAAYTEKETIISKKLKELNLDLNNINILITAYKTEKELDIFVKRKSDIKYTKLSSYIICSSSGHLGPKRQQGDNQVPEGLYFIDRFNPTSNYYLYSRLIILIKPTN